MKYSVNLRMKNPGPAKFLLNSCEVNDLTNAFYAAQNMETASNKSEEFVEIVDNESGEKIATFNEGVRPCSIVR